MKQPPNKVIAAAIQSAQGKTFTWSPTFQVFTDENGCSDYNYHAMIWMKDNGWLELQPFDGISLVSKYKIKDK